MNILSIEPVDTESQSLQQSVENRSTSEGSLSEPEEQLAEDFQATMRLKDNANTSVADSNGTLSLMPRSTETRELGEERKLTAINGPTFDYTENGRNWHGVC
jgi:hypothetical protein